MSAGAGRGQDVTDDEARDLGERLVACKGFRWMPGMLVHSGGGAVRLTDGGEMPGMLVHSGGAVRLTDGGESMLVVGQWEVPNGSGSSLFDGWLHDNAWPDLRDAATRGCVLQLLCDMYGDPNITLAYDLRTLYPKTRIWAVIRQEDNRDLAVLSEHACREEALALALEAAQ